MEAQYPSPPLFGPDWMPPLRPPRRRRGRIVAIASMAVLAIAAVVTAVVVLANGGSDSAVDAGVRSAVDDLTSAVARGDAAGVRARTCASDLVDVDNVGLRSGPGSTNPRVTVTRTEIRADDAQASGTTASGEHFDVFLHRESGVWKACTASQQTMTRP